MTSEGTDFSGRYAVVRELGRGGLGVVMLARHIALDRLVAIKRVTARFVADGQARDRLQQEARILGRLQHESVVNVYDFAYDADNALIVMEYVEGDNLDERRIAMAPDAVWSLGVIADIAAGLTHAHRREIVHLDLKPSNVLIGLDGRAKVGDFGLARLLGPRNTAGAPDTPGPAGTPGYMAPEQILGLATDARSDAYAFAATAYLLLTGRPVFDHRESAALQEAHLRETPTPPTGVLDGFPESASDAILAGLAKSPEKRASVAEMARAIGAVDFARYPTPRPAVPDVGAPYELLLTEGAPLQPETIVVRHDPAPQGLLGPVLLPVYSPPRPNRLRRSALLAGAAAAAIAVTTAVVLSTRGHGRLAIRALRLAVAPQEASCPKATYTFTATLTTNGQGGPIQFQWLKPGGDRTPPAVVQLPSHTSNPQVQLKFTVDGTTSAAMTATLEILGPSRLSATSPVARYTC
jgi:hypothetical protein